MKADNLDIVRMFTQVHRPTLLHAREGFFAVGHTDESLIQHLLGVMHKYNLQCINNILGNFGNILAVLLRKQHRCYACACCSKQFSRKPPIASTRPLRVISPVIASLARTGMPVSALATAVISEIPADGPSFGTAPSGT